MNKDREQGSGSADASLGFTRLADLPMEDLQSPDMVQAFKDLNTLHPDFGSRAHDALVRIFMWCRRADAILKARSAPEPQAKGPSPVLPPDGAAEGGGDHG
jgi:hypothetical protein